MAGEKSSAIPNLSLPFGGIGSAVPAVEDAVRILWAHWPGCSAPGGGILPHVQLILSWSLLLKIAPPWVMAAPAWMSVRVRAEFFWFRYICMHMVTGEMVAEFTTSREGRKADRQTAESIFSTSWQSQARLARINMRMGSWMQRGHVGTTMHEYIAGITGLQWKATYHQQ